MSKIRNILPLVCEPNLLIVYTWSGRGWTSWGSRIYETWEFFPSNTDSNLFTTGYRVKLFHGGNYDRLKCRNSDAFWLFFFPPTDVELTSWNDSNLSPLVWEKSLFTREMFLHLWLFTRVYDIGSTRRDMLQTHKWEGVKCKTLWETYCAFDLKPFETH